MRRQKAALEEQKARDMAKYGARPSKKNSARASHSVHSKGKYYNKYKKTSKVPKIPTRMSQTGANFSKSCSNFSMG
jgi:hypothetical protein